MDTNYEPKVEKAPYVEKVLVSGKENSSTYPRLVEDAIKAMFAWQDEVLKFADMRVAANIQFVSDVTKAKDPGDFARIMTGHFSSMYAHILTAWRRAGHGSLRPF